MIKHLKFDEIKQNKFKKRNRYVVDDVLVTGSHTILIPLSFKKSKFKKWHNTVKNIERSIPKICLAPLIHSDYYDKI